MKQSVVKVNEHFSGHATVDGSLHFKGRDSAMLGVVLFGLFAPEARTRGAQTGKESGSHDRGHVLYRHPVGVAVAADLLEQLENRQQRASIRDFEDQQQQVEDLYLLQSVGDF